MKKWIWLLNVVVVLSFIVAPRASPTLVEAQGPGRITDDGSGGSRTPFVPGGGLPTPEGQASSPQALPDYMELVFMSDSAGDWNVYQWKDNVATRLTPDPDTDWVPRAAPGGGRVAFVSERDGNSEIYVIDFDGTNERRLTNNEHEEWYPSWSPSGTRLAFSSDRDGDHEIFVMDVDGSYVTQLTHNDDWDSHPAYSQDGKQIVFTKWNDVDGDTIWIMNADGSGQRRLIAKPAGADDYYPAWSPDGKKIVFTRYDPAAGNDDIWEYTLATGAMRNLTNNPAGDWAAVVSSDSQWIAFSSNRTGDEEVWLMPAAGGAPQNISQNPLADDRYPDFFWPRIAVQKSVSAAQVVIGAPWQQASTWLPPGVPTQWDRVLIPAAMTVSITDGPPTGPRKVVRHLTVNGTLNGSCDVPVEAPRGITVGAGGLIEAGNQWYTQKGCAVDLRAWPNGTMTINGTVLGGSGRPNALDRDGGPVYLLAKNVAMNGSVQGGDGGSMPSRMGLYLTWNRGGNGGSVTAHGESITVGAGGTVSGGDGGDTDPTWTDSTCWGYPQHGGNGGPVFLGSGALASYGGTRNLTVQGTVGALPGGRVSGGTGGNVIGDHAGHGGNGGDVKLNVQWGVWGVLNIGPGAWLGGGDGGGSLGLFGHPVWGGNGGDVITLASFSTTVGGTLSGGARGWGEEAGCCGPGVLLCGADGFRGNVTAHPPTIAFSSTAQVNGNDIWIYGGEGWGIDLSQVEPGAIAAGGSITVAVGDSSGQIDLRGHQAGEHVLTAGQDIFLYADAGRIQLDPGVSEGDLTDPPAQVAPARILRRGVLHAEADTIHLADATATITLTLTNLGSGADTFQFTAQDTGGWPWHLSPGSLSLDPMAEGAVIATAVIPAEAVGLSNEVTFSARSAADPSQVAVVDLSLYVTEIWQVYLPLILRNFGP